MAFLYVTEQGALIRKEGQRLIVEKDDEILADIPAVKVESVLVFGNVQFTTQAVRLMLENNMEMALFSSKGRLLGQLTSPMPKNIVIRQAQYARHQEQEFVEGFARAITSAKIRNCLEFLREYSHNHPDLDLSLEKAQVQDGLQASEKASDSQSILGIEGSAARAYFAAFSKMIGAGFTFTGRKRRPPPDPVNALLSLGYTMIYNELNSLLDGIGFDPFLGFLHQPRYGHATLASDIVEEFRAPLVDRFTLKLINNRMLKPEDFVVHPPSGGVYLSHESRKNYFAEYEKFVNSPMKLADENSPLSFRRLFLRQAQRLRETVLEKTVYRPFTFSW